MWSVKRFHKYVYARQFELFTDHQPLQCIFNVNKGIPEMSSSRVQRWAVTLSAYEFTVKSRPTGKHGNADVCSRFSLKETDDSFEILELQPKEYKDFPSMFAIYIPWMKRSHYWMLN